MWISISLIAQLGICMHASFISILLFVKAFRSYKRNKTSFPISRSQKFPLMLQVETSIIAAF